MAVNLQTPLVYIATRLYPLAFKGDRTVRRLTFIMRPKSLTAYCSSLPFTGNQFSMPTTITSDMFGGNR